MDLSTLVRFLLVHIGAFGCGYEVALLPPGMEAASVLIGKRGIEVLIDLKAALEGDAQRFPLNVHVLFRGDAQGLSAGEILARIQKGLEENPFKLGNASVRAKYLLTSHTSIIPATVNGEPRTDGILSVDLHTSTYELTVAPVEAKAS